MARWKRAARATVHRPLYAAEVRYDTLKWRLKRRFGWLAPLRIQPYRGFGNRERISLTGRVLELNEIPLGPILLRDLGLDKHKFIKGGHEQKLDKIQTILGTIPDLPFLLIGDSGQDDPPLYREAIRRFPGRIRAVYIRDVAAKNRAEVEDLAAEARADNVEMLLVSDSYEAARHAADRGLIASAQLDEIHADRDEDRTSSRPSV